jgi:hypothetical protein
MTVLIAVAILIVILAIGFASLFRGVYTLNQKYEFIVKFRNKFIKFAVAYFEQDKLNEGEYRWLLENVDEASLMLGSAARMTYRPPFANYIINDYELLINLIPEFNTSTGAHRDNVTSAESILTRFSGTLKKTIDKERGKLKNPIVWLVEGIAVILSLPFLLLNEFGLLNGRLYDKVRQGRLIKFLAGAIGIISTADTINTTFTGNSFTIELIKRLLK